MTDLTQNPLTVADVDRMADSLPPLSGKYPTTPEEVARTRDALAVISKPADQQWIRGRIGTLLMHYYVSKIPKAVVRAISDDWIAELEDFPEWALAASCAWWISRHNQKARHKKPLPGDISDHAFKLCAPIRTGQTQIDNFARHGSNPPAYLASGASVA